MSPRKCIFCDQELTGNRAKEHVVAQWLLEHLQIRDDDLLQAVARTSDSQIVESRTIVTRSMVEGRVCDRCNNGWMSDLENQVKSLLILLIDGKRTVYALTDEERLLVSRWSAKTAYVLSHATPLKETVEPTHLRFIAGNSTNLRPGVGVFAQQAVSTREFAYYQRNRWPEFTMVPGAGDPLPGSYKIALEFRRLMLLIAYWPSPSAAFVLAAGVHLPLWPIQNFYLCYYSPTEPPTPYDSHVVLDRFGSSLGIAYRSAADVPPGSATR